MRPAGRFQGGPHFTDFVTKKRKRPEGALKACARCLGMGKGPARGMPIRPGELVQIDTLFVNVAPDKAVKHFTAYGLRRRRTRPHSAATSNAPKARGDTWFRPAVWSVFSLAAG